MPKWTIFFGHLQSPRARVSGILWLPLAFFVLSACGGPPGGAAPTALPPGERLDQPTAVFLASTPTAAAETGSTTESNAVQAMVATQIALRAQETPESETPTPTATLAPVTQANPARSALIDSALTNPTSIGIVGGGAAFFASPGGAVLQSLPAGTTLTITGRSGDGGWYAAYLGDGRAGWVSAGAVRIFGDPGELKVVSESFSPSIVATLIAEANRPVTPIPTTAPATPRPTTSVATTTPGTPTQPTTAPTAAAETPSGPQASVIVDGVNVRAGPGTEFDVVGSLVRGNTATISGRNEAGDWLQIETPQGIGWIFAPLIETSIPIAELPIVGG